MHMRNQDGIGRTRLRWDRSIALGLLALMTCAARPAPDLRLLPQPVSVTLGKGSFEIGANSAIALDTGDVGARHAADWLVELVRRTHGQSLRIASTQAGEIRFRRVRSSPREGYAIEVTSSGATIESSDDAGFIHGATTLWQLIDNQRRLPAVKIVDAPRFAWRGVMLDSARHFQSPRFVKTFIDAMAANKLNVLHWHLTDDQGWRIEIRKYPRLTQVGAFRRPATAPNAPPLPAIGGFYTQDEIRDVVAHASRRGITVVPEIEMPGHALAAIRAYPRLGTGAPIPAGVESHWGVFPWLYNVDEGTFGFLQDVLTEVMELFPSRYIHVGGDEAVKDQWRASPAVQARMKTLGISNEAGLQSWFIKRMERFLSARGRKLIGWDEILDGGIAPGATVMSWRGVDGAIAAAKAGHDAILSPAPTLYLNHLQSESSFEGPGRGGAVTLRQVYSFDPMPSALPQSLRHHVLGLQGNLWTEHMRGEDLVAYMAFPRASAVAEIGWSPARTRDFSSFARRLVPQVDRMAAIGTKAAPSAYAPRATSRFDPISGRVAVTLAVEAPLPILYTLDGSAPGPRSARYTKPLDLDLPTRLRAVSADGKAILPGALDQSFDAQSVRRRSDRELRSCAGKVPLALEDDAPADRPRASFLIDILQPCWIFADAPLQGVRAISIDVGQVPFNFQVGRDRDGISFRPPVTAAGEFEVRLGCEGERIAILPLATATRRAGITRLTGPTTRQGASGDLCITYTAGGPDPLWVVSAVQLVAE